MGYRSKVVIVARGELAQRLLAQEFVRYADDHRTKEHDGVTYHLFRFDWIKWDDDFEEIKTIQDALDAYPEDYKFLRIGDDAEDMEVINGFWEDEPFDTGVSVDIEYS